MEKYVGKSSTESDNLFQQFLKASRQVCDDLNMSYKDVKAERYETPTVGISYSADGVGEHFRFNFHLKTESENKDVLSGMMSSSLEIFYSESSAPFYIYEENLNSLVPHSDFLSRWTAWAIFNFNLKHNPVNLESIFHGMDIRVYGLPKHTFPTMEEAHMLFGGIMHHHPDKLLVYRFRHLDPDVKYRSFSYAFLVSHNNFHTYWVFFPNCGGLDSGGASSDLHTMENLIKSVNTKVERKIFDIRYEDLERFLQKNAMGFKTEIDDADVQVYFSTPSAEAFGTEFVQLYGKFNERYSVEDYSGALRDLRAVVQEAMEITCTKKNIDLGNIQNKKISNISEKMKKSQLIDETLYNWFLAFISEANKASHGGFPTKKDFENYVLRKRVMTTFLLGTHLVEELENILSPQRPMETMTVGDFVINIVNADPIPVDQTFHEKVDGI